MKKINTNELIDFSKANKITLICGNTNDRAVIEKIKGMGVTWFCSDYPTTHFLP